MTRHGRSLLTAALLGALTLPAWATDWPRFRGPNGAGVATDQHLPVTWTPTKGLLWKVPLPGPGNGSPIVLGEKVILQAAAKDGQRLLLCLSAKGGKTLWSQAAPGQAVKKHDKNTYASNTPATDGERVYAVFWDGHSQAVHAFDLDGKPVWQHDLGTFTSQHGSGTSPVAFGGRVFVADDQDGSATLVALDARTGKPAWTAPRRPFRACYSAPFILEEGGAAQLIVASTAGITSYKPESGEVNWDWKWAFEGQPLRTVASPIAADGLILANGGEGAGGRHLVAVKADGKGEVGKTALAWEMKRNAPYVPSLLAWKDHVYFVNDRGSAGCLDAKTGQLVWLEEKLTKAKCSFSASPVLVDGKVYAVSEEGTVFVFAANPAKFELLGKTELGEAVLASPAVANGRIYFRGEKHLFCVGNGG